MACAFASSTETYVVEPKTTDRRNCSDMSAVERERERERGGGDRRADN
jgi:hypothetical protein